MINALKTALSGKSAHIAAMVVAVAGVGLSGCDDVGGDPARQIGAHPALPALQQYLLPPIWIAEPTAWGDDTPKAAKGLQVHALATGFQHPRSLYVLPNGDVLVHRFHGTDHLQGIHAACSALYADL